MPDDPTQTASPIAPPRSDRDIQRAAVSELIALSTETATAEADIEREHRTSLEQARQTSSDREFEIEQRHKRDHDEASQKHEQKLAEISAKHQAERTRLGVADQSSRQAIETEKQSLDEKLRHKYDQAVWMADSVLELTNNGIAAEYKAATEKIEAENQALNAAEIEGAELVQKYGAPLPTDDPPVQSDPQIEQDADAAYEKHLESVRQHVDELHRMPVAGLFVGVRPFLLTILFVALAAAAVQFQAQSTEPQWKPLGIYAGGTLVLSVLIGLLLRIVANRKIRAVQLPLHVELSLARQAAEQQLINAKRKRSVDQETAIDVRNKEVAAAKGEIAPFGAKVARDRDAKLTAKQAEFSQAMSRMETAREAETAEIEQWLRRQLHDLDHRRVHELKATKLRTEERLKQIEQRHQERSQSLQEKWTAGLAGIAAPIDTSGHTVPSDRDWTDPSWKSWKPPRAFASQVRFGEMQVELSQVAENVPKKLTLPATFSLPALLVFPAQASLLIHTDHAGRGDALRVLQMLMARLLTSLPAGRVRFTIIDPVGLGQNFAGFMHLADYDDALVGGRIWTSQDQIEHRLANLTDHMETVIQKYLRNEFETIDQYNAQAGELAEPYRFLVIADLPINFSSEAFRRLNSIATSGARCGVYTLVVRDTRAPLPAGAHLDELKTNSVNLVRKEDRFEWDDPVFRQLPLKLDAPPPEDALTEILHKVGAAAKESKRVEVAFETIAPSTDKIWSGSTTSELNVPIGRLGANRLQLLRLGRGVAQHVLIAGKTGSGKSTLLHAMITNSAMWYSPDELELYLIDFKKGVEFKTYARHLLPHARAIAVESDREFGLSVLQRLDAELGRRGELFRKASVQDLASYRKTAGALIIPRTLLMIDEFQEFFTEDDKLAQEAALLIDRLVRQGRAFGVHVLLGSQTIGGAGGLPRSTLGQMAVRIALQTTEADSQLILGDNNSAARLLSRPGEAIYNDAGGLVEGNSPFQVAWLPDEKRDQYLSMLAARAQPYFERFGEPNVFEGNAAADIRRNAALTAAVEAAAWKPGITAGLFWLGEPVAIKEATAVTLRRQAGANVLMVGQQDEQAMALMIAGLAGLAAQQSPTAAKFHVMDGTAADSVLAGTFEKLKATLPHDVQLVEWRATESTIDQIATEVRNRLENEGSPGPAIYLCIHGLQRYRQLRKQEDDFSFSVSDEPKKPNPGKQFGEILRDGPAVGVHVIAWADTLVAVDRTLDRSSMREFDNRILFQMSAADSSTLIDSPAANKLGFFRALIYSEEQGVMERFRPYAIPTADWLNHLKAKLFARGDAPGAGRQSA